MLKNDFYFDEGMNYKTCTDMPKAIATALIGLFKGENIGKMFVKA